MKKSLLPIAIAIVIILTISILTELPISTRAQPPREETLYILMDGGPAGCPGQFNPYNPMCWDSHPLNEAILEHFFYCPYYSGEVIPGLEYEAGGLIPWLASGYELSPDFKELTIYLRKGIKWSDGEPFTSEDVVFTYEMLKEHAPKLGWSALVAEWIDSVEAVDVYTVKFRLTKPNPRIVRTELFTVMIWGAVTPVPKHIWEKYRDDPLKFTNNPPVTTGPYRLVEYSKTGDYSLWERRDDWWATELFGIRPAPKYIVGRGYTTEEPVLIDASKHMLDVLGYVTAGSFKDLRTKNPYIISWYDAPPYAWAEVCPLWMPINCAKYPLNMKEVRWAISYAIDRQAICDVALEGTATPYNNVFSPYMASKFMDLVTGMGDEYHATEYNPDKTIEIFEKLGFKKGADGIWVTPNGTRLELTCLIHAGWLFVKKAGLQVVDQLKRVGIDAVPKLLEGPAFTAALQTGAFDLVPAYWICGSVDEPYITLNYFHSKWVVPIGETGLGTLGLCKWRNETYDKIVDELGGMSPEDPAYLDKVKEALEIWYQELPAICFTHQPALIAYDEYYWTGWPRATNAYIQPYYQCATFHFVLLNLKPTRIEYTTIYFVKDVPRFRGIDLTWYGPFRAGDAARIPVDDAEFWIRKGYASYTPPVITPPPVTYVTVYATVDISAFTGVDGKSYGPYRVGDAMVIPKDDADRLVAAGKATYTPPAPKELPEIASAVSDLIGRVSRLETSVSELRTAIDRVGTSVSGVSDAVSTLAATMSKLSDQIGAVTSTVTGIGVATIVLVVIAIALVFIRTRPTK